MAKFVDKKPKHWLLKSHKISAKRIAELIMPRLLGLVCVVISILIVLALSDVGHFFMAIRIICDLVIIFVVGSLLVNGVRLLILGV
jgi:hypothetical protein